MLCGTIPNGFFSLHLGWVHPLSPPPPRRCREPTPPAALPLFSAPQYSICTCHTESLSPPFWAVSPSIVCFFQRVFAPASCSSHESLYSWRLTRSLMTLPQRSLPWSLCLKVHSRPPDGGHITLLHFPTLINIRMFSVMYLVFCYLSC